MSAGARRHTSLSVVAAATLQLAERPGQYFPAARDEPPHPRGALREDSEVSASAGPTRQAGTATFGMWML